MYSIELWICTFDYALVLRGKPGLVDATVGKIYSGLICLLREQGFSQRKMSSKIQFSWKEDLVEQAIDCLHLLVSIGASTHNLPAKDAVGILRALNSSRVLWNGQAVGERGYIDYILDQIGYDEEEAENLAGEIIGDLHGSQVQSELTRIDEARNS